MCLTSVQMNEYAAGVSHVCHDTLCLRDLSSATSGDATLATFLLQFVRVCCKSLMSYDL